MTDLQVYIAMIAKSDQSFEKKVEKDRIAVSIDGNQRDVYAYFTPDGKYMSTHCGN